MPNSQHKMATRKWGCADPLLTFQMQQPAVAAVVVAAAVAVAKTV